MTTDKTKMAIVVVIAVIVIAAAAAFVVLGNDDDNNEKHESPNSITIDAGETITQEQLDDLKSNAANDSDLNLTYNTASGYKVVFDNKAIMNIKEVADLKATEVDEKTLDAKVQGILPDGPASSTSPTGTTPTSATAPSP